MPNQSFNVPAKAEKWKMLIRLKPEWQAENWRKMGNGKIWKIYAHVPLFNSPVQNPFTKNKTVYQNNLIHNEASFLATTAETFYCAQKIGEGKKGRKKSSKRKTGMEEEQKRQVKENWRREVKDSRREELKEQMGGNSNFSPKDCNVEKLDEGLEGKPFLKEHNFFVMGFHPLFAEMKVRAWDPWLETLHQTIT